MLLRNFDGSLRGGVSSLIGAAADPLLGEWFSKAFWPATFYALGKRYLRELSFEWIESTFTDIVAAFDPNEIIGPAGVGDERWVSALEPLDYTVRFDNDPLLATAPARRVRIMVPLDADLDPRSVRIDDFGFGDLIVDVAGDRGFYASRLDLRETLGVYVDVVAGVNIIPGEVRTGEVFWEMTAIDPATGQQPLDPLSGFLPPNLDGSEGQGFAHFSVRARNTTESGASVTAEAEIVFDNNPPVDTPKWNNTLDSQEPVSTVTEVASGPSQGVYQVTWAGEDEPAGAGLHGFDVYLASDDGPFELWKSGTGLRSSLFAAEPNKHYAFYSVAADRTGNRELAPLAADATIGLNHVVVGRRLFYAGSALASESDDNAIAPDKTALLPGETATSANYTSYAGGITGLMIDIADLPAEVTLDPAADFEFRTGNESQTSEWTHVTVDPNVSIRRGEGTGGSDRVVLTWPAGTIRNTWLEVRVVANANTGLLEDDLFYFGNLTGDVTGDGLTNATDFAAVRANPAGFLNPATVDNLFDLDRDGRVNAADLLLVRDHAAGLHAALTMITPDGSAGKTSAAKAVTGLPEPEESESEGLLVKQKQAVSSETLTHEEAVDQACPPAAALIGQECFDFVGRGNDPPHVERHPADELVIAGQVRRIATQLNQLRIDVTIDRIVRRQMSTRRRIELARLGLHDLAGDFMALVPIASLLGSGFPAVRLIQLGQFGRGRVGEGVVAVMGQRQRRFVLGRQQLKVLLSQAADRHQRLAHFRPVILAAGQQFPLENMLAAGQLDRDHLLRMADRRRMLIGIVRFD